MLDVSKIRYMIIWLNGQQSCIKKGICALTWLALGELETVNWEYYKFTMDDFYLFGYSIYLCRKLNI
jgi:hypothetical protein